MKEFEEENVPIGALFMTLGVTTFFTIAIILGLTGLYEGSHTYYSDEWGNIDPEDVEQYREEQHEGLTTYSKGEGDVVRVPIDRAIELVLEERQ